MHEIVRIHADAMSPYQPRCKRKKIPFSPRSLKHIISIYPHPVKQNRELIHKRNINITLSILNNFCSLSHLHCRSPVHTRLHNQLIDTSHQIKRLTITPRHNLHSVLQRMLSITRIYPLRRIPHLKIHPTLQPAERLKHRHTLLLGTPRVNRRLINNHIPPLQIFTHTFSSTQQRR